MKKIIFILSLLTCSLSQAQFIENAPWMQNINVNERAESKNPVTFQEVVNAFNNYWETRDPNVKGSGYKPFKRWEAYWGNYVKEDGTLPTQKELWDTYVSTKNTSTQKSFVDLSDWQPVGPFTHVNSGSWSSGQGRVNVVVKDAAISGAYYAGAPAGGFWKSTDNGATWETTTDLLPQIGVSGIAVDYANPGTIYIATGDDDGGDSFSVGVLKSTDAGQTWNTTGLNAGNSPSRMNDIYISETDANTLWVATNNGVFKTTNGGTSWSNQNGTQGVNIRDIKIKPGDPNTIYAVSSNRFYNSTDSGNTFTPITTNASGLPLTNVSRYVIDVTPANPNVVYVLAATNQNDFRGIYKSSDSGNNFVTLGVTLASPSSTGEIFESTQTWFDMAFAVSDTNENEIYTGVLNIWKGIVNNGQANFTKINNWSSPNTSTYTHADIHYLRYFEGELLVGSDGGFYKSDNDAVSFTDLTGGMQISQFYRISVSKNSSDKMVGGLQDNGGHGYSNNQWHNYYGADGMDTAIDPANSNLYYGFIQNGDRLYVSTTAPSFGVPMGVLEIDDINPDNIYAATLSFSNTSENNVLRKSTNRGVTFTDIGPTSFNPSIPSSKWITSIEVSTSDSSIVYVTTSGATGLVYKSTDGGLSFNSISNGLPNVTKNIIKHQGFHSKNPLYLGTSLGVYRYDDDILAWELFNIGFPNVTVRDLEINLADDKITAATYGRGIWQSVIPTELAPTDVKLLSVRGISDNMQCDANISPEIMIENNGLSAITAVDIIYTIDGTDNIYNWTGTLNSEATTIVTIPTFNLTKGPHTFKSVVNTTNDAYAINNNSEEKTFTVTGKAVTEVVNTFETPAEALLVQDDGATTQYWQRGIPSGTLLNDSANPTNQVYGTNLAGDYVNNVKSFLVSECYDLTTISDPVIKFDMAFDLETDWDIAYMEYSTDQGANWSVLGNATDPNWYNSDTTAGENNTCFNCPGAQWTGQSASLIEYSYDLTAFTNEASIIFRFVFQSDVTAVEEGVIVDNLVVEGNVLSVDEFETDNFSVYPNPSQGIFNIKTKNMTSFNYNIYDVTGKVILEKQNVKTSNNEHQINIGNYAKGVYFLNLYNDSVKVTKKLIIK